MQVARPCGWEVAEGDSGGMFQVGTLDVRTLDVPFPPLDFDADPGSFG